MANKGKEVGGFVLAGGESARMGQNKALLELDGEALVVRTTRLIESVVKSATVVGSPEAYAELGLPAIRDGWPAGGPLGGIATALRATESEWNLIVACDLPHLTKQWLSYLVHRAASSPADAVLPMNVAGAEPLCAMYNKSSEAAVWLALDRGTRKVTDALASLHVEYIEQDEWKTFDPDGWLFKNMNSMADYEDARIKLQKRKCADERR